MQIWEQDWVQRLSDVTSVAIFIQEEGLSFFVEYLLSWEKNVWSHDQWCSHRIHPQFLMPEQFGSNIVQ